MNGRITRCFLGEVEDAKVLTDFVENEIYKFLSAGRLPMSGAEMGAAPEIS